jgi:hypothetical protein
VPFAGLPIYRVFENLIAHHAARDVRFLVLRSAAA